MTKIAILDAHVNNPGDLSWDPLNKYGDVTVYDRTSPEEVPERVKDVDIAITNKITWDKAALEAAPKLKLIALTSTGYNTVELEEAKKREVTVCNVPAYSTPDVAQMAIGLLLELCLDIAGHSQSVREGKWIESEDFSYWNRPLVELSGKTIGIAGMGHIGQSVATISQAFGMKVLFYNRSKKPELESDTCTQVELDELYRSSDFVSLHLPASPETEKMIDAKAIAQMKDGAYLINTARGTLLDEQAVADALNDGKLGGAGLDVVAVEPMEQDNPLRLAKNTVITPHISWATKEARTRLLNKVFENIKAYLDGNPQNTVG